MKVVSCYVNYYLAAMLCMVNYWCLCGCHFTWALRHPTKLCELSGIVIFLYCVWKVRAHTEVERQQDVGQRCWEWLASVREKTYGTVSVPASRQQRSRRQIVSCSIHAAVCWSPSLSHCWCQHHQRAVPVNMIVDVYWVPVYRDLLYTVCQKNWTLFHLSITFANTVWFYFNNSFTDADRN